MRKQTEDRDERNRGEFSGGAVEREMTENRPEKPQKTDRPREDRADDSHIGKASE